jgi:hypothetical protein
MTYEQAADVVSGMDALEREKLLIKFKRQMDSPKPTVRPGAEILTKWQAAHACNDRAGKTLLFIEWLAANGSWAQVELNIKMDKKSSRDNMEKEGWVTFGQLIDLYKETPENCPIATAVKEQKLALNLVRRHPEVPHLEDACLFWAYKELSTTKLDTTSTSSSLNASVAVSDDQIPELMKDMSKGQTLLSPSDAVRHMRVGV